MSKIIYVTTEALRMALNKDYGMKLPKDTKFVLTSEHDKEKEQNYVSDLEAKLADTEFRYENLHNLYYKDTEQLKQQLAEKDVDLIALDTENYSFKQQIDNLRQQLAEKDVEETKRMELFEKRCQEYYKSKEFTIERLEKVKDKLRQNITITAPVGEIKKLKDYLISVDDYIDNQIKQLKEGK